MIEFVSTPLPVRIAQQGCHSNHAFSYSPNEFMFGNILFSFRGGGRIFFGTNEKFSLGCKVDQIGFCGIGYHISVLIREIAYPWGIPLCIAFLIFEFSILFYIRTHLQTFWPQLLD